MEKKIGEKAAKPTRLFKDLVAYRLGAGLARGWCWWLQLV